MTRTPSGGPGGLRGAFTTAVISYVVRVTYRLNYNARRADSGLSPRRTITTGRLVATANTQGLMSTVEAVREVNRVLSNTNAITTLRKAVTEADSESNRSSTVELVRLEPQIQGIRMVERGQATPRRQGFVAQLGGAFREAFGDYVRQERDRFIQQARSEAADVVEQQLGRGFGQFVRQGVARDRAARRAAAAVLRGLFRR